MALEGLDRFTGDSPLEAFLYLFLKSRLKNFKRNHSYRIDIKCVKCSTFNPECPGCAKKEHTQNKKKSLLQAIDISNHTDTLLKHENNDIEHDISVLMKKIDSVLSPDERLDYLRIKDEVYIPKKRKEEIIGKVKEIIDDYFNE